MKKRLYLLALFSIFVLVLLSLSTFVFSKKALAVDTTPPGDQECHWVNAAHLICTYDLTIETGASFTTGRDEETKCSGDVDLTYECDDYYFDANASKALGYVVFNGNKNDKWLLFTTDDPRRAYYLDDDSFNGHEDIIRYAKANNIKYGSPTNETVNKASKSLDAGDSGDCSVLNTGSCKGAGPTEPLSGKGLDAKNFLDKAEQIKQNEALMDSCNNSVTLGFIFCPILETVNDGIAAMIGGGDVVDGERKSVLVSFLQLPPLLGSESAVGAVVGNVVTVANVLYVFIFLAIIFSTSLPLGLSNYNIKKMLPKFIAAVIMTQFSLVICGTIVDVFNLLGQVVPNVIFFLSAGAGARVEGGGAGVVGGIGGVIAGGILGASIGAIVFILLFIVAIIALISAFIAVIYMVIRYFVLYALVIIAPLAFVSWVLPGTEKFFKGWWNNFIRLNAMYVTIMGMLSLALLMSRVLTTISDDPLQALIAALIPCIALMLVPKTLKWTTQGMSALAGGAMGALAGKAESAGKSVASKSGNFAKDKAKQASNDYRSKKAAEMFGKGKDKRAALLMGKMPSKKGLRQARETSAKTAQEKANLNQASLADQGNNLQGLKIRGRNIAAAKADLMNQLMARGYSAGRAEKIATNLLDSRETQAQLAGQAGYDKAIASGISPAAARIQAENEYYKVLDEEMGGNDLYSVELGKIASGKGSELLGVKAGDRELQLSAVTELSKRGDFDKIHEGLSSGNLSVDVMMKGIQQNIGDVMAKAPDLVKGANGAFDAISAEKVLSLDKETVKRMVSHAESSEGTAARANLESVIQIIEADPKLKASLDPKVKDTINNARELDASGNPTGRSLLTNRFI